MRDEYIYYVYMMQSVSRHALYIGMTSNLRKRVWEHKNQIREGSCDDYNCTRLVYWESFDDVANAIDREKQLKRWRREKKECLIARKNPGWKDLAVDWYETELRVEALYHCHPERSKAIREADRFTKSRDLVVCRESRCASGGSVERTNVRAILRIRDWVIREIGLGLTQGPSTAVLVHWRERASSLGMTMAF
jgi:putative endonuclease